jgi:hypothetical protein
MTIVFNATTGITTPPVSVEGSTSGTITLVAPAVAGTNTQTLVAATGTLAPIVSGTAVTTTSGTSFDFTSIPSWVKRITVMFNGVSLSGTSALLVQIGDSGGIESTGYNSSACNQVGTVTSSTAGFVLVGNSAALTVSGILTLVLLSSNTWVESHSTKLSTAASGYGGGDKQLSDVLDRIRITTVNGTDVFDAGSINILYE